MSPPKEFQPKKQSLHTRRKVRRVRKLVNSGASNRQVTAATRRATTSINAAQAQGTYGRGARRATRRTIRALSSDTSIYSKRGAVALRQARKPGIQTNLGQGLGLGMKNPPKKHPDIGSPGHKPKKQSQPGPQGPGRDDRREKGKKKARKRGRGDKNQAPKKDPYEPKKLGKAGRKLSNRIEEITENRYLRSSDKLVNQQVVAFRKKRKKIRKRIEGPKEKKREKRAIKAARKELIEDVRTRGTAAPKLYRKAGLAVSAELDPQLKGLTSRIKQTRREKKRTLKDLRGIYKRALRQHRGYRERMNKGAKKDIKTTNEQFDDLVSTISGQYDASEGQVRSELERLGISAAAPAATSGLTRDKAYATSLARTASAESTSEQRTNKSGYNQLMSLLGGEMGAQGLGARTEARQKFTDALMQYRDQRSALAATRLGKISTAAEAIKASNAQARSQALQDQLAYQMANREFGLEVNKFRADQQQRAIENRLAWKKFGLDKYETLTENLAAKKPKSRREYGNSHGGAVDFLRDRGANGSVIDRYNSFVRHLENDSEIIEVIGSVIGGIFGKPRKPIPRDKSNRAIRIAIKRLKQRGLSDKTARAYADALRIEWGLV